MRVKLAAMASRRWYSGREDSSQKLIVKCSSRKIKNGRRRIECFLGIMVAVRRSRTRRFSCRTTKLF